MRRATRWSTAPTRSTTLPSTTVQPPLQASVSVRQRATGAELLARAVANDTRSIWGVLDFIHQAETIDCQRVAHGLEAIGALTYMGVQCTARADVRMCWERGAG
jgi:hypothetical protein